jgi:hypothetical protein
MIIKTVFKKKCVREAGAGPADGRLETLQALQFWQWSSWEE